VDKPTFDPGLTQQYTSSFKRAVNPDGQFNVRRTGATWRDANPYLFLVSISWTRFLLIVGAAYLVVNSIFALLYLAVGIEHLKGTETSPNLGGFMNAWFFSAHTLTTVGYGNVWPSGLAANGLSALEALAGLLAFAIATGVFYGRFSRPSARVGFSPKAIIAPYQGGTSLQFRVVNRRTNNLLEVEARVLLMSVDGGDGRPRRNFVELELERKAVLFLPLTWTVVHPIDERSPLFGKTAADLEQLQSEILVVMRAFDETFGQPVHSRFSYRYDEIIWGAKFTPAFEVEADGDLRVELNRLGNFDRTALPSAVETNR